MKTEQSFNVFKLHTWSPTTWCHSKCHLEYRPPYNPRGSVSALYIKIWRMQPSPHTITIRRNSEYFKGYPLSVPIYLSISCLIKGFVKLVSFLYVCVFFCILPFLVWKPAKSKNCLIIKLPYSMCYALLLRVKCLLTLYLHNNHKQLFFSSFFFMVFIKHNDNQGRWNVLINDLVRARISADKESRHPPLRSKPFPLVLLFSLSSLPFYMIPLSHSQTLLHAELLFI